MDQNARQQIIDRLKEANNVLITVSANPSVDQLAACIGITLVLNHLKKHATAVFSGAIPSTIEFLKPEATIEKNTDSLRDFIIALDKAKADKLRYKVEDKVVKIFITPYRTSLSDKDLDFSQGDFNVDAVLALGVHERSELDQAIVAHGRILHDATVISVNNKDQGNLGAINWVDLNSSSLSEMLALLTKGLVTEAIDGQMATAFMTGIVAETDRFSNDKTSPQTMSLASELMSAGANQQLIASKLEDKQPIPVKDAVTDEATQDDVDDGTGLLQISHQETDKKPAKTETPEAVLPAPVEELPVSEPVSKPEEKVEDSNDLLGETPKSMINPPIMTHATAIGSAVDRTPASTTNDSPKPTGNMAWQPPSLGGQLTANSQPEHLQNEPSTDPFSLSSANSQTPPPPILNRPTSLSGEPVRSVGTTLSGIEESVSSPHLDEKPLADTTEPKAEVIEEAREAVDEAISAQPTNAPLNPLERLNASPAVDLNPPANPTPFGAPPNTNGVNPNIPTSLLPPSQPTDPTASVGDPTAPPPVPPPMPMPPSQ
ncbi:MAG: hypothetical protein ABIQ89_01265 [Candidatus Saccharimonadales bacterium]